jgi:hypothetical protein
LRFTNLKTIFVMKNIFFASLTLLVFSFSNQVHAQRRSSNNTGIGFQMDFGDGQTYAGFGVKHFFNSRIAGAAHLLFARGNTLLGFEVQPHFPIRGAAGLKWYVGAGAGFNFYSDKYYRNRSTLVILRPMIGLDYQLRTAPLAFNFDWRPMIFINQGGGNEVGRFGFGIRYTF